MAGRVSKEYDVRKNELLDVAMQLFTNHGYEATTVNEIIDAAQISKGTFYHYFDSKEELLDALAHRITLEMMERIDAALRAPGLSAVEKLNAFFQEAALWKSANFETLYLLLKVLYSDENILLRHHIERHMLSRGVEIGTEIIEQGVAEGVFRVELVRETAEVIFTLLTGVRESDAAIYVEKWGTAELWDLVVRRAHAEQHAIERILGAPDDSIKLLSEQTAAELRAKYEEYRAVRAGQRAGACEERGASASTAQGGSAR